jgi:putative protease
MVLSELLAPAGSYPIFVVAVNAGANAIYLSGKQFGARAFAENFTIEEIEKSLKYAHLNGVKVYVTVNTLINNFEIVTLLKYLFHLYKIGVDAIIVQDLGVVYLINKLLPDLKIHASTQMTLNNFSSVLWASENGISRVIFPREININEISNIHLKLKENNINMDLEVFGHGALCYSISGNCYISSYNNGRSGNRGACTQPCRREYKLKYKGYNIGNGYLLSTRDLGTYDYLNELEKAGVYSLKLEGRMKSEDYIGTIVNSYRNIIDKNEGDFKNDLHHVFNRQFSKGYLLNENPGNVMGRENSGHQGVYIGDVIKFEKSTATISIKNKENYRLLEKGDGIAFKYKDKIKGIYLDNIVKQTKDYVIFKTSRNLRAGDKVFISYSRSAHKQLKKFKKETIKPNLPISLKITWSDDLNLSIYAEFTRNKIIYNFTYISEAKFEKAVNSPITIEKIEEQLRKTGHTPFFIENIKIEEIPGNLFVPISELNKIRRDILDKAQELLLNSYTPFKKSIKSTRKNLDDFIQNYENYNHEKEFKNLKLSIFIDDINLLKIIIKYPIDKIYFDATCLYNNPKDYFNNISNLLEEASLIAIENNCELVWVLSSFISEEEALKSGKIVDDLKIRGIPISVMGDYPGIKKIFNCKTYGHHNLNIWNNYSVENLSYARFNGLILSSELSKEEIKELILKNKRKDIDLAMIIHGNLEIIVSYDDFSNLNNGKDFIINNNSDYAILEDKKRKRFKYKVNFDYNKKSHIRNKDCLCLIDELINIKKLGLDSVILDCRFSNENYTKNILSLYHQGLNTNNIEELKKFRLKIMNFSQSYINKGNFIDGRLHEK